MGGSWGSNYPILQAGIWENNPLISFVGMLSGIIDGCGNQIMKHPRTKRASGFWRKLNKLREQIVRKSSCPVFGISSNNCDPGVIGRAPRSVRKVYWSQLVDFHFLQNT